MLPGGGLASVQSQERLRVIGDSPLGGLMGLGLCQELEQTDVFVSTHSLPPNLCNSGSVRNLCLLKPITQSQEIMKMLERYT